MCQCRGYRFNPWSRKIPHATKGQLIPSTTTTEACVLRAHAPQQEKSLQWKACSVQFSRSVVSDFLQPHGLQHARLPCPSPTPRAYSNSRPLTRWCHPTILSTVPFLLPPSIFPSIRVFSNESVLHIRVAKILELQHQSFQWIFRTDFL